MSSDIQLLYKPETEQNRVCRMSTSLSYVMMEESSTLWLKLNKSSGEEVSTQAAGAIGIGIGIGAAVGGLLLLTIVIAVSVLLYHRHIKLKHQAAQSHEEACVMPLEQTAGGSLWTTKASQSRRMQSVMLTVIGESLEDASPEPGVLSSHSHVKGTPEQPLQRSKSSTAEAPAAAAVQPAQQHSVAAAASLWAPPCYPVPEVSLCLPPRCAVPGASTLPPGYSAPVACSRRDRSSIHQCQPAYAIQGGTAASLEQLTGDDWSQTRAGRSSAREMLQPMSLLAQQRHSRASADSGLASSMSSFGDDSIAAGGCSVASAASAAADVRSSSQYSLTSHKSLQLLPHSLGRSSAAPPPDSEADDDDDDVDVDEQRSAYRLHRRTLRGGGSDDGRGAAAADDIPEEVAGGLEIGCSLDSIAKLVSQFERLRSTGGSNGSSNGVPVGAVYCTPSFAIADFDQSGGCLYFTPDRSCSLTIPPGALDKRQMVYFGVIYERGGRGDGDELANFTPTYECGPSGLRFLKTVQLRTTHCIGSDIDPSQVSAYVREGDCSEWSSGSTDTDVSYGSGEAVLNLMHFTGYKLAASIPTSSGSGCGSGSGGPPRSISRIPRPVGQPVPSIQKRLYLCCFRCEGKVRVRYMNQDDVLYDKICAEEIALGNTVSSPKKPFVFTSIEGDLIVKVEHGHNIERRFVARDVLVYTNDYAELSRIDGIPSFDILIKQEYGTAESYIAATFENRRQSGELSTISLKCLSEVLLLPLSESMVRQMSRTQSVSLGGAAALYDAVSPPLLPTYHQPQPPAIETATPVFGSLPAARSASAEVAGHPQACGPLGPDAAAAAVQGTAYISARPATAAATAEETASIRQPRGRSSSSNAQAAAAAASPMTLPLSTAVESCECMTAAAAGSAFCALHYRHDAGGSTRCLSPGEYSDDSSSANSYPMPLQRSKARASQESGYLSVSSVQFAPFPSFAELHGPESLSASIHEPASCASTVGAAPAAVVLAVDDELTTAAAAAAAAAVSPAETSIWQHQQSAVSLPLVYQEDRTLVVRAAEPTWQGCEATSSTHGAASVAIDAELPPPYNVLAANLQWRPSVGRDHHGAPALPPGRIGRRNL